MSESVFYGAVVNGKKPVAIVPRPQSPNEADECLHISQVCIPATSALPLNTRVSLVLKVGDGEPICIATLKVGHTDCVTVSILVDQYAELSVTGHKGAEVHVSGYYAPSGEPGEEDEDEDEGEEEGEEMDDGELNGMSLRDRVDRIEDYLAALQDEGDDDDDDDEDMEDDDDEDDDEEGEDLPGETRTKHTHIKELKQDDDEDEKEEDAQAAGGNDDEDDEGQEEEDDDDDEDDEDDDDGVGMAELMEKIAAENARAKAAKKRKAEESNGAEAGKKVKTENKKPEIKKGDEKKKAAEDKGGEDKGKVEKKVFANGFEVHSVKSGAPDAKQAKPGKRVVVKYQGTLQSNGKVFDETKGDKTFSFRLGVGEVIKGWDKGVAGMRVGDKRKLVVPPSLAYGATGVKDLIPPNSTLLFDVELVDVR